MTISSKPIFNALYTALDQELQELSNQLANQITFKQVDNATGKVLEGIGSNVGEYRNGEEDDRLRARIYLAFNSLSSNGTYEYIVQALEKIKDFGLLTSYEIYSPQTTPPELNGHIRIIINDSDNVDSDWFYNKLINMVCAGINLQLTVLPDPASLFTYDTGPGYDNGQYSAEYY